MVLIRLGLHISILELLLIKHSYIHIYLVVITRYLQLYIWIFVCLCTTHIYYICVPSSVLLVREDIRNYSG